MKIKKGQKYRALVDYVDRRNVVSKRLGHFREGDVVEVYQIGFSDKEDTGWRSAFVEVGLVKAEKTEENRAGHEVYEGYLDKMLEETAKDNLIPLDVFQACFEEIQ